MNNNKPEVWLRGSLAKIPALLQPAAHALLQAKEDVEKYTTDFPEQLLWEKPAGRASVGFHMQHLTGVLDRMLTYAAGKPLSETQFEYLKNEGNPETHSSVKSLTEPFKSKMEEALKVIENTPEATLTEKRTVGRKKLPSTVIGLLFHAAEHSHRHVGQLLVTVSVLKEGNRF
ncbi:hypothetical protein GCM10007103_04760 [Salinimicrobium marinum]|uniref:DinB-like domain-containing protein n=1 Tax=Salinimicrobium marinum TaxID=680283 RepID=A0A918VT47_9FLAO|nr:DinB family protein [Salinimicrobium marinum]GHA26438.1 hypothetical protein GCM10007103_04760 [Salinimicrobium marinum]